MQPRLYPDLTPTCSQIAPERRQQLWACRPGTVWLTGLSGAGKSTLAYALEKALFERGVPSLVLDGDNVRLGLNRDLGFGDEARRENIRRVAEVARLVNRSGLLVITALISPYEADRAMAREIIGAPQFLEVHLDTALQVCEQRDPKGLYRKARARLLPGFTGVSAGYEAPTQPGLRLDTGRLGVQACVQQLLQAMAPLLLTPIAQREAA